MITTLIDFLVQLVINIIATTGYAGVFLLMLLESCGVPAPSEAIMPFAGFLVAAHQFSFWLTVLIGALGNLAGSLLAYFIGLKGGRPLVEKYGRYILISKHDLDKADLWFQKRGELTVFIGRLLPVVRTYISFPAGIAKMNLKKFSLYTFIGAFIWSALFCYLGVKLGANWEIIRTKLHNFDLAILALVIIVIVWFFYRHWKKRNKIIKV
ncbi:alkaline phosphatase [Candidatus Kuenenbacteria bacterium CG23_combo_of_CG06-09_8_20_14_all_36_9]|nr:MAG: alkaline phosphatase [Candidatus Kuenenbacteria bacterium CG23_combo_of_CG06-09_8_20_14_all_36_9]